MKRQRLCIFASGEGSNAENIIKYFNKHAEIEVSSVLTNNVNAGVIKKCQESNIPVHYFENEAFLNGDIILTLLKKEKVDFIVLAGFLKKIPEKILLSFPQRIINIHPSLLPKYGGKGMYGRHVHESVLANKEKISGITIHLVNEEYDKGDILAQYSVEIFPEESLETLQNKIQNLEYQYFPRVIEEYIREK